MTEPATILVIDDELDMTMLIRTFLEKENMAVIGATNGAEGIKMLAGHKVDLVLLDIMMPEMDGFETCRRIRQLTNIPIIMLTAKDHEEDKVRALKLGADDYVLKPFSPRELIARIEAVMRRTNTVQPPSEIILEGPLVIDRRARSVKVESELINLTRREFDLLVYLMDHKKQVFTREQLHDQLWGMDFERGTLRTVDTHIKTLRIKLKSAGQLIQTVWGVGYKFDV